MTMIFFFLGLINAADLVRIVDRSDAGLLEMEIWGDLVLLMGDDLKEWHRYVPSHCI